MDATLAQELDSHRPALLGYLLRLVIRPQQAEDLVQSTFLRALESSRPLPPRGNELRAWLFRVATNLAIDERRRHSSWRENMLGDLREAAESNPTVLARSMALASTPETRYIAREHLSACTACTLRNLRIHVAAALLLKEIYDFSISEAADILECSPAQLKNWVQEARDLMRQRYAETCVLIAKSGVCHQCAELNDFFATGEPVPALHRSRHIDERLRIARELHERPWSAWHQLVFSLIDDLESGTDS